MRYFIGGECNSSCRGKSPRNDEKHDLQDPGYAVPNAIHVEPQYMTVSSQQSYNSGKESHEYEFRVLTSQTLQMSSDKGSNVMAVPRGMLNDKNDEQDPAPNLINADIMCPNKKCELSSGIEHTYLTIDDMPLQHTYANSAL